MSRFGSKQFIQHIDTVPKISSSTPTSSDRSGKPFEARVADVYRAMGYQVTPNVQLPGKQTDILARQEIDGAPPIVLAIECKDWAVPVDNETVLSFVSAATTHRAASIISSGILVSASGFTAPARAAVADIPYVSLLSWEELATQVLNVRHQLREVVATYESAPIYHNYLPLAIEPLSWSTLTALTQSAPSMPQILDDWMGRSDSSSDAAKTLFVLADFGAGKTTLLSRLNYDRAKAHLANEDHRVPLFVRLREFRDTHDMTTLLRSSFRDAYYRDLPTDLIMQRVKEGYFYLLLDGFDEMVERSDATRRLDLFYALLEILESACPSIVTSRPSYFVDRGELNGLFELLLKHEATIAAPATPTHGGTFAAADRLRRKLVSRHREIGTHAPTTDQIGGPGVRALRILPLDRGRVKALIERRGAELSAVSASPEAVMAFIDRTYDLADLASRPLLLNLIVDSVLLGGLDLDDTETQFGASGLYEIYTSAKLEIDYAKGRSRQGGLSVHSRRMLAESLAVRMYRASVLEVDFHDMLEDMLGAEGEATLGLDDKGLTGQEIAADFAACSFVTLDHDGMCRFVHKSFRGFFVARAIKDLSEKPHELLSDWLEREVLYFLGGFGPTQPDVEERIWARFLRTDPEMRSLRRNLLVAFLYTKPDHDSRKIADAVIADAEFGRLRFIDARMVDTTWRNCVVMKLELSAVKWKGVQLIETQFADVQVDGGELALALRTATIESLEMRDAKCELALSSSSVHRWVMRDSDATLKTEASRIREIQVVRGAFVHSPLDPNEPKDLLLEQVEAEDSRLRLIATNVVEMRAARSVITWEGDHSRMFRWGLQDCAVILTGKVGGAGGQVSGVTSGATWVNDRSVLLPSEEIAVPLLRAACGVFGVVGVSAVRAIGRKRPRAWGVMDASVMINDESVPSGAAGIRHGEMLLVGSSWYAEQVSPDGALSAVHNLRNLATFGPAASRETARTDELLGLLHEARAQHQQLLQLKWGDPDELKGKTRRR